MGQDDGRAFVKVTKNKRSSESKHSHVEFGTTRSRWDREDGADFAITTVNVPDRLDAQEVRARANADAAPPSVRRFSRIDITRFAGWFIAVALLAAVAWGTVRLAGPLRDAMSPHGVEAQVSQALGMPVSVRSTDLRLVPSPRLVISDLRGPGGLRLPEITVSFNWRDAVQALQTSSWVLGEASVAPVALSGEQALRLLQSIRRAN